MAGTRPTPPSRSIPCRTSRRGPARARRIPNSPTVQGRLTMCREMKVRPRRLSRWLLLGLGLMLAPQVVGAAIALGNRQWGMLAAFATALLLALPVARVLTASIRAPLDELRNSARRLGSGDLAHRVELDSFTELNQVADSFNQMADALRTSDRELSHRAFHDTPTGLANRPLLFDRIGHALERRDRPAVAVVFIDLDDFKTFNDTLGHSRGDEVLVEVGRRLRGGLRPSDTVARLGGDEFAVLVEDLSETHGATAVAERILLALARPVEIGGRELALSASLGVAVSGDELCDADALVRAADLAMHAAKA